MRPGRVEDVEHYIQALVEALPGAFLTIEVPDVPDGFLQFSCAPTSILMDHPLITDAQIGRDAIFRQACAAVGLAPYETRGSDGARFLDCVLPGDARAAAAAIASVLKDMFGVTPTTELQFAGDGV